MVHGLALALVLKLGNAVVGQKAPDPLNPSSLPEDNRSALTKAPSGSIVRGHKAPDPLNPWGLPAEDNRSALTKAGEEVLICEFSRYPAMYPSWEVEQPTGFDEALKALFDLGLEVQLDAGTLLGAYRHQGSIPFDLDMDVVLDLTRPANLETLRLADESLSLEKLRKEKERGAQEFNGWLWELLQKLLVDWSALRADWGWTLGLRLQSPFENAKVDLLVRLEPQGELCECKYGSALAYCSDKTEDYLLREYGEDFIVPKDQCRYYSSRKEWWAKWAALYRSAYECTWAAKAFEQRMASLPPAERAAEERLKRQHAGAVLTWLVLALAPL